MILKRFLIILAYISITSFIGASMMYVGNTYIPNEVTIYNEEISNNIDNNITVPEIQIAELEVIEEVIPETIVENVENVTENTEPQIANEEIIVSVTTPITNSYVETVNTVIETVNVETPVIDNNVETKEEVQIVEPTPVIDEHELNCSNGVHSLDTGNSGKWFGTKEEAIAEYTQLQKSYGDKLRNKEITKDDYYKNCPYGYEVWSCMYCNKWTINYYLH